MPLLAVGIGGVLLFWARAKSEPDLLSAPPGPTAPATSTSPEFPSPPASSGAGAPAEDVRGGLRVHVSADGKPLAGVPVTICREENHQEMKFETQEGGLRTILNLPPGAYHIEIKLAGYVPYFTYFTVSPKQGTTHRAELKRENVIEGSVRDVNSRPLALARITVVDPKTGGQVSAAALPFQADAEGAYRIPGLPPGLYGVRAWVEGYRSGPTQKTEFTGYGERRELHFTLETGLSLTGRVLDDQGKPVAGAAVVASNEEVVTGRSDEQGAFRLRGLGVGTVSAFASHEGHSTTHLFGLRPGAEDVTFQIARNASLSGSFKAPALPRAWALLLEVEEPETNRWVPAKREIGDVEDQNRFSVGNVPPGTYRVSIEAPGYETVERLLLTLGPGERREGVALELKAAASR